MWKSEDIRKITDRIVGIICAFTIAFMTIPMDTSAQTDQTEKFRHDMAESAQLLRRAIDGQIAEANSKLKDTVIKKGLDYKLTMESFGEQADPYAGADYNELIMAYITAKEMAGKSSTASMYRLPLVQVRVKKTDTSFYEPLKIKRYKKDERGNYIPDGYDYITEPTSITRYRLKPDGSYEAIGDIETMPKKTKVTYGEVTMTGLDPEGIFEFFGIEPTEEVMLAYRKKLAQAEAIMNGRGLGESINVKLPSEGDIAPEIRSLLDRVISSDELPIERRYVIATAQSLIGKVPYEWGGKSQAAGYDSRWWTYTADGKQKGLDCSGYVQWVFRTVGADGWEEIPNTAQMLTKLKTISVNELTAGDLGLLNNGKAINHVGIYLGSGVWIHNSSAAGTVTAQVTDMFTIYKQMPDVAGIDVTDLEEKIEKVASAQPTVSGNRSVVMVASAEEAEAIREENAASMDAEGQIETIPVAEGDVYLLAQLIAHEARYEGLNGWIAVGEVVRNRLMSPDFPSTVSQVIYQPGQFTNSHEITGITPTEGELAAAEGALTGQMSVLGDVNVLYFRNAHGSTADWGRFRYYTTVNNHQFYLGRS